MKCRCPADTCPAAAGRRRLLSVTSPFWRTKNGSSHSGWPVFDVSGGTRTISCRCPVDICSAAAGRRRLHNITSPFWRTGNEPSHSGWPVFDVSGGLEPFNTDVRWTSVRRRIGRYTVRPSRRERPACRSAQPRYLHDTTKGVPSVQTASHSTGYSGPSGNGRCADGTAHRPFPDSSNIIPFILPPKYNFSSWWIHPKGTGHIQSNIQIQQGKFSAAQGIFLRKRVEFPGCV